MCKARSQGGQRCVGHARAALEKAVKRHSDAVAMADATSLVGGGALPVGVQRRLLKAEGVLVDAMAQFASTPEGHDELSLRLARLDGKTGGSDPTFESPTMLQVALMEGGLLHDQVTGWVTQPERLAWS